MSAYGPDEIPVKTGLPPDAGGTGARLPIHLRQLLVMVDGHRTVRELCSLGLRGVSPESFEELYALGLIEGGSGSPSRFHATVAPEMVQAAAPRRGLSEARFAVIDVLLDISMKDFAVRPWVERMEKASSMDHLANEVAAFIASPLGKKYEGSVLVKLQTAMG